MALTCLFFAPSMLLLSLLVIASATDYGYTPKPEVEKPNPQVKENILRTRIGIQGLVLCKSGPKIIPLQGAVTRITCLAVDDQGYETAPFSILCDPTDAKGYFFATLCSSQLENKLKITECKAFLEDSPLETCKVPTDINKGISGALLASYRVLDDKNMNLYSLEPFFYTSEPQSVSNGY